MNQYDVFRMVVSIALLATSLFISTANATVAVDPVESHVVQKAIVLEARRNGVVPPALALAVARVESNFRTDALSPAGARGVMQIMPATALGEFGVSAERLWDGETNVRLGITFLEQLYRRYGDDWRLALSHYNGGSLKRVGGRHVPHSYTAGYVADVHRWWQAYRRDKALTGPVQATGGAALAFAQQVDGSDKLTTDRHLPPDMVRPVGDRGQQQPRIPDADRLPCQTCAEVHGDPALDAGLGEARFTRSVRVRKSRFR